MRNIINSNDFHHLRVAFKIIGAGAFQAPTRLTTAGMFPKAASRLGFVDVSTFINDPFSPVCSVLLIKIILTLNWLIKPPKLTH